MNKIVESKREHVAELCRRFHVRRLDVFGSATSDRFDPERSDIDFVLELEDLPPVEYSDAWFGLKENLEALFGRPVDLLTYRAIENPYLLRSITETRESLYAA
jgi:predicted nucleotidyltransferase